MQRLGRSRMLFLGQVLAIVLSSWQFVFPQIASQPRSRELLLGLRHEYALDDVSRLVFADAPTALEAPAYILRTQRTHAKRPRSRAVFEAARMSRQGIDVPWEDDEVDGPDVSDRETLLVLAKMTNNAYLASPGTKGWYSLGDEWNNNSYPVGWEPDADGFRGHVFTTPDNSTVVLSIKGTSVAYLSGGPTVRKDKLNDNLLFSCCCAKVGPTWSPVCGCHAGGWKCDNDCAEDSLKDDNLFYAIGTALYDSLAYRYPHARIWLVGHSLGGSLAALLGATFGAPVVAFEAPAERRAARRLHLPLHPELSHITHIFHTADPIPVGACTGVNSACATGGFALETQCHLGRKIVYDTVQRLKWGVSARTHSIATVINKILSTDWDPDQLLRHIVPQPIDEDPDCDISECYKWEYGDFLNRSHVLH